MIGRFIQEDTYLGDGLNLFAYCQNNPLVYWDPTGHWCENKEASIQFIMQRDNVSIEEAEQTYNEFRNTGNNKFKSAAEIREILTGEEHTEFVGTDNILGKDISKWTDEELQRAVDSIQNAEANGNERTRRNVPVAVTVQDGRVIVTKASKDGKTLSPKARDTARMIFGDDVEFPKGTEHNYTEDPSKGHHSEARGIQYMINEGMDTEGAVQVCSHNSCLDCTYKQDKHDVYNPTGSIRDADVRTIQRDYVDNLWS